MMNNFHSDNTKKTEPQPWLANKVLNLYPETHGMKTLLVEISNAIKIRVDSETMAVVKKFNSLGIEDGASLVTQSAFSKQFFWAEWSHDPEMPGWPPSPSAELLRMGVLARTAPNGQVGRMDFLGETENEIFVMPLSLVFNWQKSFKGDQKAIESLRDNLIQVELERKTDITEPYLDSLLELRRRFSFESSPYLEIPESAQAKMKQAFTLSVNFLVDFELYVVGLANVLECCQIEDWRGARLVQH